MTEFFTLALSSPWAFIGTCILLFLIGVILEQVAIIIGDAIVKVWGK